MALQQNASKQNASRQKFLNAKYLSSKIPPNSNPNLALSIFLDCVHRFDLMIFITLYIVKYKFNAGYAVLIHYRCRSDVNCGHVQTCHES